jgi:hypothetical protein
MLFAVAAASLFVASAAPAQTTAPDAGTTATKPAPKKGTSTKKKTSKKGKKAPPPAPPKQEIDEETRKALESMSPTPTPAPAPSPAPPPAATATQEPAGPVDNDLPTLSHTPVTTARKGKPLTVTARASDPSGVFGPVLYLRKKGMPAADYIPMRMAPSKTGAAGEYSIEIPALLISADALEYYIEVWDNAGNGPVRAGAPDSPLPIKVEEEKKIIVKPTEPPPPTVTVKPKGAPPALTHTAVTQATKGQSIELNARIGGDTGVQGAAIMFRHVGEKEYKALPMGQIGPDDYTATVPAGMATSDIEYYLEAFDKYGNGPGRSGAPNVPYTIKVLEPHVGESVTSAGRGPTGPRIVKAPFKPNPGRAAGWLLMGGFVGGLVFAGGEAFAAMSAHNSYTHTFNYEGRLDPDMLAKANVYGKRAKTAAIVGGISLVGAIVLLVVFPEHSETIVIGGGGDVGVRF